MSGNDLWIFGYGSLMWDPGFEHVERVIATLPGYARSFCMWSVHHRGTEKRPGLVLALDRLSGASCRGLGFRVHPRAHDETMRVLRERELVSYAYLEKVLDVVLADGRLVPAVTYVIDPAHRQYSGGLGREEQAQIISAARGGRGPNSAYLHNTVSHLAELGLEDGDLSWLSQRVRQLTPPRP